MIKQLWPGVSRTSYNDWFPLTGKILATPNQYIDTWPNVDDWFKVFALRAQNDINAYLNFILSKFPFASYKDPLIQETLIDMVFIIIEHWVYNRTPIEFNTDTSLVTSDGTQINNFATPTINIWDLHPSRMKIWANLTQLKAIFDTAEEEAIDPTLIDLEQFYTKLETDEAIATAIEDINISSYETKAEHGIDLTTVTEIFNARLDQQAETINTKQDLLTDNPQNGNIKRINGLSILGTGNLTIQGGSGGINSIISGVGIDIEDTTGNGDFVIKLVLPTINGQNVVGQDNVDVAVPDDIKWENASISPASIRPKNNYYISGNNLRILSVGTPIVGSDAVNLNYINVGTISTGSIATKLLINNPYDSLDTNNKSIISAINELKNRPNWVPVDNIQVSPDSNQIVLPIGNLAADYVNYRLWISQEVTNQHTPACFQFALSAFVLIQQENNVETVLGIFRTRSGLTGTINDNQIVGFKRNGTQYVIETRTANNNGTTNVVFNGFNSKWLEMENVK